MGNKRVVTANRKDFIMKKDVLVGVKYNITANFSRTTTPETRFLGFQPTKTIHRAEKSANY